jgi:hypothetical protein
MIDVKAYKVGDKVRMVSNIPFPKGSIQEIERIEKAPYLDATVFYFKGMKQATVYDDPKDENDYDWEKIKGGKKVKKVATKEIKVGDKVKLIEDYDYSGMKGELAIVKGHDGDFLKIEFINDPPAGIGHSCGGVCRDKHGWNVPLKNVELAKRSHKKATPTIDRKATPFVVGDVVEFKEIYKVHDMKVGDRVTLTRVGAKDGCQLLYYVDKGSEIGVYASRVKLAKGAQSKAVEPKLVEDPRTFYKVLRIDGCPANIDARRTGFKYELPVEGPTEWTPRIESLILCERGYHIIEAKDIKRWVTTEYCGVDTIVCECKARGDIKQGDNKCVAESIQLTKILYRWEDAKKNYDRAEKIRGVEREHEMKELQKQFDADRAKINTDYDKSIKEMGEKFFVAGE